MSQMPHLSCQKKKKKGNKISPNIKPWLPFLSWYSWFKSIWLRGCIEVWTAQHLLCIRTGCGSKEAEVSKIQKSRRGDKLWRTWWKKILYPGGLCTSRLPLDPSQFLQSFLSSFCSSCRLTGNHIRKRSLRIQRNQTFGEGIRSLNPFWYPNDFRSRQRWHSFIFIVCYLYVAFD